MPKVPFPPLAKTNQLSPELVRFFHRHSHQAQIFPCADANRYQWHKEEQEPGHKANHMTATYCPLAALCKAVKLPSRSETVLL